MRAGTVRRRGDGRVPQFVMEIVMGVGVDVRGSCGMLRLMAWRVSAATFLCLSAVRGRAEGGSRVIFERNHVWTAGPCPV